jgi:hypothetical protein
MTPQDIRYYSSTHGAVGELLAFANASLENTSLDKDVDLVLEEKEDHIQHLNVAQGAIRDERMQHILVCLQKTLERVSEHEIRQTFSLLNKDVEPSWNSFQVAQKALNVFMERLHLPKISLRAADVHPHMQVYPTPAAACNALYEVFQSLGSRAEGTYTLSQNENQVQLHILGQDGAITGFTFTLVTDQLGKMILVQGDRQYPSVEYFLNQLHVNKIYAQLEGKQAGTYSTAKIGQQNLLYLVLPSNKIASYSYTFQTSARPVYASQKGSFSSAEELIKANFPALAVTIRSQKGSVDSSNDPVGTFCELGSGFTASISVITEKNKVETISYTADVRPEQFCVIQGCSYKSIHAFVQENSRWKVNEHKLDTSQLRPSSAYPSLLQENIERQISDQFPGTFSMYEGSLYLVTSRDEVKRYAGISDPYTFVMSCAPKPLLLEAQLSPFYPLEVVCTQIEAITALRDSFGCQCLESEEIALLQLFEGAQPHPFFLRPVQPGHRGDFTLVAGLQYSKGGVKLPVWQENIEILPGGKIAHISHKTRGTYGRIFENFAQMKEWWGLGSFIYDAYVAMEEAIEPDHVIPRSFTVWKKDDQFFVTVKKDETFIYELTRAQGTFFLEYNGDKTEISGELIQSLERIFDVSPFPVAYQLQEALAPFVEQAHPVDERVRFQKFSNHGTLFSVVLEKEKYMLTTYTPRGYAMQYLFSPTVEKLPINSTVSGQVLLGTAHAFQSIKEFTAYLNQMRSIKLLEVQSKEKLDFVVRVKREAADIVFENRENALRFIQRAWALVGAQSARGCALYPNEDGFSFIAVYKDEAGSEHHEPLEITHDVTATLKKLQLVRISQFASDQEKVEKLFEKLSKREDFVTGGKLAVERAFSPYKSQLVSLTDKPYMLCKDSDEDGIYQLYCSWVDQNGTVVHSAVSEKDCERAAAGKKVFKGSSFISKKLELDESKRRFSENCAAILANQNFYNITHAEVVERFTELTDFFDDDVTKMSWLIRPNVATETSFFSRGTNPDVTKCVIEVVDIDGALEYKLSIDRETGKFLLDDTIYETLEEVCSASGADFQKTYSTVFEGIALCQQQEKLLIDSGVATQIDETHYKVLSEVVTARNHPGFLTGRDGTIYKDIEDVVKSLEYQKAVPSIKKEKAKTKPKVSAQIDLKQDERYLLLGVGDKDLTPETRIRRLIIWLDELAETEDRCSKLEAQVILPWIGPKDSVERFMKKPLRTMNLPRDIAHLQKSNVVDMLQLFLRTARG